MNDRAGALRKRSLQIAALLGIAVLALYARTLGFGFVNYDDDKYIVANDVVQGGLSLRGVVWAFSSFFASNWHPLTWLSHMLDCQLFGMRAGGHHLTSVLLHAATTIGLFLILVDLTKVLWPNALFAALFALHPLRVESVAWIAERKDVLCGLFFVLSLGAYVRYVRKPTARRYAALASAFALGLMAKPMIVTLPLVLLLLDVWPLRRISGLNWGARTGSQAGAAGGQGEGRVATGAPPAGAVRGPGARREAATGGPARGSSPAESAAQGTAAGSECARVRGSRALIEKAPLFGLSAASCLVAVAAQRSGGALRSFEALPAGARIANALVASVEYLLMTAAPRGLAVLYPFETRVPPWRVAGSIVILGGVTALAISLRRTRPAILVGWLWYLTMLLPVIGLIQLGAQSCADRYTYLPGIGLLIAIVHGALAPLLESNRALRAPAALGGAAAVAVLAALSWRQIGFWRSSVALFERAVAVTKANGIAHGNLGAALANEGRIDEALVHDQEAARIRPDFATARLNLGLALFQKGRIDEAIPEFRSAVRLDPESGDARLNLGAVLAMKGKVAEALAELQEAARLLPGDVLAQYNLGLAHQALGHSGEAIGAFTRALSIDPGHADSLFGLATELAKSGRAAEAASTLERLMRVKPDYPGAARLRATLRGQGMAIRP